MALSEACKKDAHPDCHGQATVSWGAPKNQRKSRFAGRRTTGTRTDTCNCFCHSKLPPLPPQPLPADRYGRRR